MPVNRASEVTAEQFAARLGDRGAVDANLKAGKGMALYSDGRGTRLAVSYGTRDADLPGLPPRLYGGGELEVFVRPQKSPASMRSPLMDWEGGPPQIKAPPRSSSVTSYPEILISGRTSAHPRGNAEFITPLLPAREPEPTQVSPPEPANEDVAWWRTHLTGR
jgi:hypothetical protein